MTEMFITMFKGSYSKRRQSKVMVLVLRMSSHNNFPENTLNSYQTTQKTHSCKHLTEMFIFKIQRV